ncbi:hypothetical protein EPUL_005463, partial [Erysiphe pulchra]
MSSHGEIHGDEIADLEAKRGTAMPHDLLNIVTLLHTTYRFDHYDANLNFKYGLPRGPLHFFICRIFRHRRGPPPKPTSSLTHTLLGTPKGASTLSEWLDKADFFASICPRWDNGFIYFIY